MNTYKRRASKTFLIILTIFCLSLLPLLADNLPTYKGAVTDDAWVIDNPTEKKLKNLLAELEEKTSVEIAVVTVLSYAPYGSIEEFTLALAREWEMGKADKDNGVVVSLSTGESRFRIEVGYGLEGVLPDSKAGRLIDEYVLPDLKVKNYSLGLYKGTRALATVIAQSQGVVLSDEAELKAISSGEESEGVNDTFFNIIWFIIFGILVIGVFFRKAGIWLFLRIPELFKTRVRISNPYGIISLIKLLSGGFEISPPKQLGSGGFGTSSSNQLSGGGGFGTNRGFEVRVSWGFGSGSGGSIGSGGSSHGGGGGSFGGGGASRSF